MTDGTTQTNEVPALLQQENVGILTHFQGTKAVTALHIWGKGLAHTLYLAIKGNAFLTEGWKIFDTYFHTGEEKGQELVEFFEAVAKEVGQYNLQMCQDSVLGFTLLWGISTGRIDPRYEWPEDKTMMDESVATKRSGKDEAVDEVAAFMNKLFG